MKKIILFLLVLSMVLPMCLVAGAAKYGSKLPEPYTLKIGGTSYKLVNYDIPIYVMNTPVETQDVDGNVFTKVGQNILGANEDNYNAKLIWSSTDERPTLILRGFVFDEWNNETGLMEGGKFDETTGKYKKLQTYSITTGSSAPLDIILTGEDSLIEAMFGITFYNDLTITSDGATKLTMNNEASCIAPNQSTGSLTIDANLDLTLGRFYNTQYASAVIHTYGGDLTVNGGNLDLKCNTAETKVLTALHARNGANLTINGGVINAMSIIGAARNNGCIKAEGKLTINGGYITALPKDALGLHGKAGIEMNGGIVNTTAKLWAISFGKSKDEPAEFVFNGGTLTATSKRVFHEECTNIKIGQGVVAYAGTSETDAEVQGDDVTKFYTKSWIRLTNDPSHAPGWDGKDSAAPTLPSAKPIPTPSTEPATEPTQAPTTEPVTVPVTVPVTAPTVATVPQTQAPTLAPTAAATEVSRVTMPHLTLPSRPTVATAPAQTQPVASQPVASAETAPTQATRPAISAATRATRPVSVETTPVPGVTQATQTPGVTAATQTPQASQTTAATQTPGVTETTPVPGATDVTLAPTEATRMPGVSAATLVPGVTNVTLAPTDATEVTAATQATEVTEETQPTETTEPAPQDEEQEEKQGPGAMQIIVIVVAVLAVAGGGTAAWYFLIYKKKPAPKTEE